MDEVPYVQDTFSYVFEESSLEMYNKIMAQPKPFQPLFTGLNLVKKGTLAFNTDGIYAYALLKSTSKLKCADHLYFQFHCLFSLFISAILTDDELCDLQF